MNKNVLKLGRMNVGHMNKTEALYSAHLHSLQIEGKVLWFGFEAIKLRLADLTFYTPDFAVITHEGRMEMHEVKGFWMDDARVKVKVAAEKFQFFQFFGVTTASKKNGGGWLYEAF